ncbi:MAG: phosphotransferase [bacterium]
MNDKTNKVLTGGNMNSPILNNNLIYKESTEATNTIHELLCYIRSQGIKWVPKSFGINSDGQHVLSYIDGFVPHENPVWIWDENILKEVALKLRQWHDATVNFKYENAHQWVLENDEVNEVICHNDFAPYNCVFKDKAFVGLIDFDVCSPGSRIWDIAYTAYRFIPLYPYDNKDKYYEVSPFPKEVMMNRLKLFLNTYSCDDEGFLYDEKEVIAKVEKRLQVLANWSESYGLQTQNQEIQNNAKMYSLHAKWIKNLI